MRFHAGQSGHGKLHYHAGAFLRQSMVKEMAPATLCQEAVAASGPPWQVLLENLGLKAASSLSPLSLFPYNYTEF